VEETTDFCIWIDNDGCPQKVRDIVFKASLTRSIPVKIVANRYMHPPHALAEMIVVSGAFDAADDEIVDRVQSDDLVITGDIPLADRIVSKSAIALSPYGEIFTAESIKDKLAMRNLHQELRSAGMIQGGRGSLNQQDIQKFANAFDRIITKQMKTS